MGRFLAIGNAAALLAAHCVLPTAAPQAQNPPAYEVVVEKNVMVPMRDGVKLACDIHRPALNGRPAEGKFPVILERTPYDKATSQNWARYFVPRGYVCIGQDTRGRYASEGVWHFTRSDVTDGYDTARWIVEQAWCDGHIGTVGTSYPGGTQHAMALGDAPGLAAMVPTDSASNVGYYGIRHGCAFELRWMNWIYNIGLPNGSRESRDPKTREVFIDAGRHIREYVVGLPLRRGDTPLKLAPEYEDWLVAAMSHGGNDEFWRSIGIDVADHVDEYKDVPVYHVSGWYDSWAAQVANLNFALLSKAKKSRQRLIMGPWTHGGQTRSYAGEAEFGPDAAIDFNALRLRWFDRWLKGVDNGVEREPPVRIFVMGGGDAHKTPEGRLFVGGRWRDESEWPPARAVANSYYLHADGMLSPVKPGAEPPTSYQFDPRKPVPTIGGNVSSHNAPPGRQAIPGRPGDTANLMEQGAFDQRCRASFWNCVDERPLSARNDVLVFQTPLLDRDVEVTGRLIVRLWASSSAADTDFTAKLIDVYPPSADFPAGVDLNIGDSIVRARFRTGVNNPPALLKPGEAYEFTIELYPSSILFKRGHRIRLDISSSNFPRFDVNPNTGEPLNDNRRTAIAVNTVYHDARHASRIELPVITK